MVMSARYLHEADLLVQVAGVRVRGLHLPGREAGRLLEATQLLGREDGRLPVGRQRGHDVVVGGRALLRMGASGERSGGLDTRCHYEVPSAIYISYLIIIGA